MVRRVSALHFDFIPYTTYRPWQARKHTMVMDTENIRVMKEDNPYMLWYQSITHRFITHLRLGCQADTATLLILNMPTRNITYSVSFIVQ